MFGDFERRQAQMHKQFRRSAIGMFLGWIVGLLVYAAVMLGVVCGLIWFTCWCLDHFGVI